MVYLDDGKRRCGVCGEEWRPDDATVSGKDVCARCVSRFDGVARELPHVRIGRVWYYQDDRLREFRAVSNPHKRICFQEFHEKQMRIDDSKFYVANFEFGHWALDVKCRHHGHNAYVTSIGRGQWCVCDDCKACIFLGSNLISSWPEESETVWRARSEKMKKYRHYHE